MLIPQDIISGETLSLGFYDKNYPASDWSLNLYIRGASSLDVEGTPNGDSFDIFVNTESLDAGQYQYQVELIKGPEKHFAQAGFFTVKAGLEDVSAGHDPRSHVEKVLEAIEALIESRATNEHKKLKINNRELEKHSFEELVKMRKVYKSEVAILKRKRADQSLFSPIKVRF